MAFFGNSAGAHIAAMLAFELESVQALATTAAVGLAEAVEESGQQLFAGKRYLSFANADDPCAEYTHRFWEAMIARGIAVDVIERAGGHAFEDYVANGSARQASRSVRCQPLWKVGTETSTASCFSKRCHCRTSASSSSITSTR